MNLLRSLTARRICWVIGAALFVYTAYFYRTYPGLTHAFLNQLRFATLAESRRLFLDGTYWIEFTDQMRFNEATGSYDFDGLAQGSLDDFEKGRIAYHQGNFAEAISYIESDISQHGESESKLFWLAVSSMRHAEAENCLSKLVAVPHHDPGDRLLPHDHSGLCTLPLTRFHDKIESSRKAARLFERLLEDYDGTNRLYQWLLNFGYMSINAYPQEVPQKYLIQNRFIDSFHGDSKEQLEAEYAYLSFEDRANELGVDTYDTGRGVAIEDFDKDGYLDIVTGGVFNDVKYYKNDGGTIFVDRTEEVGLGGIKQPFIITAADYDNDGWVDLFISRPFDHFLLLRNTGAATFTDVTFSSRLLRRPIDDRITPTFVSAWGDIDNDGDLDLFLAQWGLKIPFTTGLLARPRMNSTLFVNENSHFVDRSEEYGLASLLEDQDFDGAAFGDYDSDGYADLFLSSHFRNTSALLRNRLGQSFERVQMRRTAPGFTVAFVDINHDGRLDIFQGGLADTRSNVEQVVFGEHLEEYQSGYSTILLQTEDNRFEEHRNFFGGRMPVSTMGASYGDLNNDGCHDFYLGTGNADGWFVLPNLMYIGEKEGTRCLGRMTNISMLQGFGTIQKGHAIVFFDFDNDGDQDVYSSLGGMWPGDGWPNQFFVNSSQLENSWIKIRLHGEKTNHFGIGAIIKVTAENQKGESIVRYQNMSNKTGFGSAPYLAHIGLMNATRVNEVEVYWPVSECRKAYKVELNQLSVLDERDCLLDF